MSFDVVDVVAGCCFCKLLWFLHVVVVDVVFVVVNVFGVAYCCI